MAKGTLKSAGNSNLAAKIRDAIGASPDEEVHVVTPQFTRPAGWSDPASPPSDEAAWQALADADATTLRELGLGPWGGEEDDNEQELPGGAFLWLFPGEWYAKIPAGLPIVNIFFRKESFVPGVTDDDIRFGCLSFGVLGPRPRRRSDAVVR